MRSPAENARLRRQLGDAFTGAMPPIIGSPGLSYQTRGHVQAAQQQQQHIGGGSGMGGVGPMGEVMTGIGMQQELNNMSSGGANAAQSRSRGGINDLSHSHTDTQNQVMDNLGL